MPAVVEATVFVFLNPIIVVFAIAYGMTMGSDPAMASLGCNSQDGCTLFGMGLIVLNYLERCCARKLTY